MGVSDCVGVPVERGTVDSERREPSKSSIPKREQERGHTLLERVEPYVGRRGEVSSLRHER